MLPFGTNGRHLKISFQRNDGARKDVSPMEFYSYHMQQRQGSYFHKCGRLYHQYIVDMYAKMNNID